MSLAEYGTKHGTDKVTHGFCQFYERVLGPMRKSANHVLEIGVFYGASLLMWQDWFDHAIIHGADSFLGKQGNGTFFPNANSFQLAQSLNPSPRIVLHTMDQGSESELTLFRNSFAEGFFDMILDDASHLMRDQQTTFAKLFPLVRPGGYFIIEDLHTSLGDYDLLPDHSNSTLLAVQKLTRGRWESQYCTAEEKAVIEAIVGQVEIYQHNGSLTCSIRRKMSADRPRSTKMLGINYASPSHAALQAKNSAWLQAFGVDLVQSFGPNDLEKAFYEKNREILDQPRGAGYWLWKPYIMLAALRNTDADMVLYCDSASTLHKSRPDLEAAMQGQDILVWRTTYPAVQWTKGDVWKFFGLTFDDTCQCSATLICVRNSALGRKFLQHWLEVCQNARLIDDSPSTTPNHPTFKENRHDQSLLDMVLRSHKHAELPYHEWIGHHSLG